MTVAATIFEQLGGNKFAVMTGSKNFMDGGHFLSMKLSRNKSGANHLRITLTASDDYTMEFIYVPSVKVIRNKETGEFTVKNEPIKTMEKIEGVYCDQLQATFTEITGLYTRLFQGIE